MSATHLYCAEHHPETAVKCGGCGRFTFRGAQSNGYDAKTWGGTYHPQTHGVQDGGGLRFDEGKERVDLLPADALMELGKVYGAGAKKYSERNWERGMPWSKVLGPLMRHLFKWMMGETVDPEDGQRHSAKIAWNAIALLTYELRAIGVDDVRPAREKEKYEHQAEESRQADKASRNKV